MKFLKDIARIWAALVERILYVLDPHKVNDEIEYLRMQVQVERNEKMSIVESLARGSQSDLTTDTVNEVIHEPVNPYIPWRVRRAQLEAEHRIKRSDPEGIGNGTNSGIRNSKTQQDIRKLEEELEIENATD